MPERTPPDDALWAVRPLVSLTWHEWDEGSVVFEATSGQIVEFDVLGAAVMACLEVAPRSVASMAEELAADLGHAADAEFRGVVGQIVEQFHRLGWAQPIIQG
jgi:PqqD family protein of HPr-rel-A system